LQAKITGESKSRESKQLTNEMNNSEHNLRNQNILTKLTGGK